MKYTNERLSAPFTRDQVASLNACQMSDDIHPYTCVKDWCVGIRLIADTDGLHCARQVCAYQQTSVYSWMADWSWREALPRLDDTDG